MQRLANLMIYKHKGFTLAEVAIGLVILTILVIFFAQGLFVQKGQAQLEATILQARDILVAAERIRTTVVQFNNGVPIYDRLLVEGPNTIEQFNRKTGGQFQQFSPFGTPFTVELIERLDPGGDPKKTVTFMQVKVVVPGEASPQGVEAAFNQGLDQTTLTFFNRPDIRANAKIKDDGRFEKSVWFEEVIR